MYLFRIHIRPQGGSASVELASVPGKVIACFSQMRSIQDHATKTLSASLPNTIQHKLDMLDSIRSTR